MEYLILGVALLSLRVHAINHFKTAYYVEKLKNRGVDISSVENIGLIGIIKL